MNHPQATPTLAVVFWAIWFAILSGLLMMQIVPRSGSPFRDGTP